MRSLSQALSCIATGTRSNLDTIGARARLFHQGVIQWRMVKGGSSYLSQPELPLTFGLGMHDRAKRIVIDWPSGSTEDFKNVATGQAYECVKGIGIRGLGTF